MPIYVTIRDVAKAAGVGKSTVARVLNSQPGVAEEQRKKILEVVQRLGYRPDPSIALLTAWRQGKRTPKRTVVVMALVCTSASTMTHWRQIHLEPLRAYAAQHGYKIEEFYLEEYPHLDRLVQVLDVRGIRGVLVGPLRDESLAGFPFDRFSAVSFYLPDCCSVAAPYVGEHHFQSMTRALDEIVLRGCSRIGVAVLSGEDGLRENFRRGAIACSAHRYSGVAEFFCWPADKHLDQKSLATWIRKEKLDAVLGNFRSEDGFFSESCLAAVEKSLRRKVAWVCASLYTPKKIAGMLYPAQTVVRTAIDLLEMQMRRQQSGAETAHIFHGIQASWHEGTRSIPARKT